MSIKQKVFSCCLRVFDEKTEALKKELADLQEGAENDSKSSAGDKHETARAMMQLEVEKISRLLDELLRKKTELEKTDIQSATGEIKSGSLIKTSNGYLFLGPSIGKISVDDIPVMTVSLQSPIGRKLSGLKTGDSMEMNGVTYVIESIA